MSKRLFDIVVALCALVAFAPVIALCAIFIKREDGGPVFYSGERVGKDGRVFRMHKLRTMVLNADAIGSAYTPADDCRVTRIGAKLRRYKIDELPQFLNVLTGEMSLVGPRPDAPRNVAGYEPLAMRLLSVRPGITDYASLRFRDEDEILRGSADPEAAHRELIWPEKVRLGLAYVDNPSIVTDIKILFATARAIVVKDAPAPEPAAEPVAAAPIGERVTA